MQRRILRRGLTGLLLLIIFYGSACSRPGQAITESTPSPVFTATPAGGAAAPTAATPTAARMIPMTCSDYGLQVELATTSEERSRGLMFRESLPENQGMLFVFPNERQVSFWMKNTYVPLSIAYIDAEGRIVNIADMQPQDTTSHPSAAAVRYALEVNQGWFAERDIAAGDRCVFQLPEDVIIQ